jgi:hypothetical protein
LRIPVSCNDCALAEKIESHRKLLLYLFVNYCRVNRRSFLTTAGVAAIGTTGCLGGESRTDSPEAVVEAWVELTAALRITGLSDIRSEAEELLHSESPFRRYLDGVEDVTGNQETGNQTVSVDSVEADVVEENLDERGLEETAPALFRTQGGVAPIIDADGRAAIAGENAVVEATVERSGDDIVDGQRQQTRTLLVAPQGGDWLVVHRL